MVWPNPNELAILTVNGVDYQDWETVYVKHSLKDRPAYQYRFTCSEDSPIAKNLGVMRIKPDDLCSVTLAGQPAITGKVYSRQVFYDAHRHFIEIRGASATLDLSGTSAIVPNQELSNVTYQQLIEALLKPYNKKLVVEGGSLPTIPFDRVRVANGETIEEVADRYARALTQNTDISISFTSNPQGDFVILVGAATGSDNLAEGVNILEAREIIYNVHMASGHSSVGQRPGNNQQWGTKVTQLYHQIAAKTFGTSIIPVISKMPFPAWNTTFLQGFSSNNRDWQGEDQITVYVTVHGWLRPSGGLWYRGQKVQVKSPMLILDGDENLIARNITFTQDNNNGTRTTLELVNATALQMLNPSGGPGGIGGSN